MSYADVGLTAPALVATITYAVVGVSIMLIAVMLTNAVFNLDIRKELVKDQNTAMGTLFAGMFIAIAIVIAASIAG